jgi:hypothetical protein
MQNKLEYEALINEVTTLEDINEDFIFEIIENLSIKEKIILKLQGSVEIGKIFIYGWKNRLPFYLFKCPDHGYQINYCSGHYMSLHCPKCLHQKAQTDELSLEPLTTDIKIEA